MAVEDLKVSRDKVDTIADFAAVEQFGVLSTSAADAATAAVVAELPTSSHGVNWRCRSPESSPSMMCRTRSGRSNCDTPAARWY